MDDDPSGCDHHDYPYWHLPRVVTCPECGYRIHASANVRDSDEDMTCTKCYTVFPVEGA